MLIKHNDQYIGCADNGLITMILEEIPQEIVALPLSKSAHKNTLYYASVFAKAFDNILSGKTLPEIGDKSISIVSKESPAPLIGQ